MQNSRYRPQPPDMPQVNTLRTTRARQVQYEEDLMTEPVILYQHEGILRRIVRGILAHWLPLAFGALLLIGLYTGYQQWVAPAWNNMQAQWHTGDGRIAQLDANVGHGGISHFLAQYYNGHIVVIEMPLSNPTHVQTYTILALMQNVGHTQDLTLTVQDVNHDGRLDLVIQEGNSSAAIVLYNTGTGFSTSGGQP